MIAAAMLADVPPVSAEGIACIAAALGITGNLAFWLRWERRTTRLETKVDIIAANIGLYEREALTHMERRKHRKFDED